MTRILITAVVGAVLSGGLGYLLLPVLRWRRVIKQRKALSVRRKLPTMVAWACNILPAKSQ